ncbi:hypothetical protein BDN72DRAFT_842881, partial [Pluteus cervinus]
DLGGYDWRIFTSGSSTSPPFGGLKEKILGAHPNRADIKENVPESVKTGVRFNVKEALLEVFRTRQRWSCQNSVLTGYSL